MGKTFIILKVSTRATPRMFSSLACPRCPCAASLHNFLLKCLHCSSGPPWLKIFLWKIRIQWYFTFDDFQCLILHCFEPLMSSYWSILEGLLLQRALAFDQGLFVPSGPTKGIFVFVRYLFSSSVTLEDRNTWTFFVIKQLLIQEKIQKNTDQKHCLDIFL